MQSGAHSLPQSSSSRKRPKLSVREDNITVLYSPSTGPALADVVFVHGLQGHARKTWQYSTDVAESTSSKWSLFGLSSRKRSRDDYEDSSDSIYWPADLLPEDYPNFRILSYGYDSHVSRYFKGPANKLNLSQLGEDMLNRLVGERSRSKVTGRPIIFVAHSLGGLLVKEAVVESKKQVHNESKRDVYDSTRAAIFFGTPHKGSEDARWGLILKTIASVAFDTNDKVLSALKPDSEMLDKLARDFQDILEDDKVKICSLLESSGKIGLPVFNRKVVPDFSASFGSRQFEHRGYINKNHMNMCRFSGKEDGGYSRFLDGMEFCIKALETVPTTENTRQVLLHSLKFDGMSSREEQLMNASAISLDWIWSLSHKHMSLTEWISIIGGLFWIQGKPGSGKSTLMSHIKNDSVTKRYLTEVSNKQWVIIRFFFDFRARDGISNSFDGLLRSFLFQLASKIPDLSPLLAEHGTIETSQPETEQELEWNVRRLREALLRGLEACSTNVLMLIDGVDECESKKKDMLDMIECFQELADIDSDQHRVKICIASRPDPLFVTAFGTSRGLKLQDHNGIGIERYVRYRLKIASPDSAMADTRGSSLEQLANAITTRAQGVFLWARFATEELIEGIADGDETSELWARLQAMPEELEAIYSRILKRIVAKYGEAYETSVMLQMAYFTLRSLSLCEFFVIFHLATRRHVPDISCSLVTFEKKIRAKTGGLVEVVDGSKTARVKLIHETARAYLQRLSGGSGRPFEDAEFKPPSIPRLTTEIVEERTPKPYVSSLSAPQSIHSFGPDIVNASVAPRGRTACVRKLLACIRCQNLRFRCESVPQGKSCRRCLQDLFPCIRSKFNSCMQFQTQPTVLQKKIFLSSLEDFPVATRSNECWGSECLMTIQLNQTHDNYNCLRLSICRILQDDSGAEPLSRPKVLNASGLRSVDQATSDLRKFIKGSLHIHIQENIHEDEIAVISFQLACSRAESDMSNSVINDVLLLWATARCLEGKWNCLKIKVSSGWVDFDEQVPITPILDYQVETIIQLQIFEPLRKGIISWLANEAWIRDQSPPYSIFCLTTFVLLHNCDLLLAQYKCPRLGKDKQKRTGPIQEFMRAIEESALQLLANFHSFSTRLSGNTSLWFVDMTNMSDHDQVLIKALQAVVQDKDIRMEGFANPANFQGNSWFTSQMFVSKWRKAPSILDVDLPHELEAVVGAIRDSTTQQDSNQVESYSI